MTQIPLDTLNVSPPPASAPPPSVPPSVSSVERAVGTVTIPTLRSSVEPEITLDHEPAMAPASTPRWLTAASASLPHETLSIEQLTVRDARAPRRNAGPLWLLSVVIIVLAIGAAYVWREPVMRAWPPSIRVYQAFGLGENA